MQMPASILKYFPFSNFLIPGIILSTLLGVYPLAVAYCLWQKPAWRWHEAINPFVRLYRSRINRQRGWITRLIQAEIQEDIFFVNRRRNELAG